MQKALGETQTLRADCSRAEPKIFRPAADPFPGARDGQNLISWRWSLPSPTDPVGWRSMHAISNYRGNRLKKPKTNKQDRLQYTAPLASAQCNKKLSYRWQTARRICANAMAWVTCYHVEFGRSALKDAARKKFDDIFSRQNTIHERDGQTDRRTVVRTDRHWATAKTALIRIASRGKK